MGDGLLPGIEIFKYWMTDTQWYIYITLHWSILIFFIFLMLLIVANFVQILIRLGKWRNVPFLMFYIFAGLAIIFRILDMVYEFDQVKHLFEFWLAFMQPVSKLCAGFIYAWIMFEVGLKVRDVLKVDRNPLSDPAES